MPQNEVRESEKTPVGRHYRDTGCTQKTGAREGRTKGSLGNTTKYASPYTPKVDLETGEILTQFDPTLKWQLQALARVALPNHRINVCMRNIRADKHEVLVRQSLESLRTYYSNLMACGSVWACPVCAPKIQHIRALEVRAAIDFWTEQGGTVVMPTHTTQHNRSDQLKELLTRFNKALQSTKSGKRYQNLKKAYGIAHSVKALELTYGSNGWHPHAHTILFLEQDADLKELAKEMFPMWKSAAARAGLREPSEKHGLTVVDASEVKTYVTKMGIEYQWNVEHELVKAHSKSGKKQSYSPFDFLRANLEKSDPHLLSRFSEFAYTFHGRRQLVWSNGSKKALLGHEGKTDQQIADSIGKLDPVLASIGAEHWKIIRKNNLQGDLLQVADNYGLEGVRNFLFGLNQ